MVPSIRKIISVLAISLVVAVISQAGVTMAATMPTVTVQQPVDWNSASSVPPRSPSIDRITVDASGNVYAHDNGLGAGGIVQLNNAGQFVKLIPYTNPIGGIAARADGHLIVGFGTYAAIVDPATGAIEKRLGTQGTPEGDFFKTGGIAIDGSGYIYVVESGYYATWGVQSSHTMGCVKVYNYNGDPVSVGTATPGYPSNSFGASGGAADGSATEPSGIAYDRVNNQIIVVDTMNGRLNFWNVNGYAFAKTIGSQGAGQMQFVLPRGVAIDYSSAAGTRLYVVDTPQSQVKVIDPAGSGTELGVIGKFGSNNGDLQSPSDVFYDATNNLLLVSNGLPNNITVYGIDGGVTAGGPYMTINPVPPYSGTNPTRITGTAKPGMTIDITVNGGAAVQVPAGNISGNSWFYDVPSSTNGTYNISVVAVDPVSLTQVGPKTASFQKVTLAAAPACTMAATPALTNLSSLSLSGVTSAGAKVTVYNPATGVTANATVAGTAWSYTAPLAGDMFNNFQVTCSLNPALPAPPTNFDAVVNRSIESDVTPPVIALLGLPDYMYTNVATLSVNGRITDLHTPSTITVKRNTDTPVSATVQADTSFSSPVVLNIVGDNTITIVATDLAGNTTTLVRHVTYDNAGPNLVVTTPANNSFVSVSPVTVSGTVDDPKALVKVNGTPVPVIAGAYSTTVPVTAGPANVITVTATDLAANTVTVTRNVTLDTTVPSLSITSPASDISTKNPSITFTGTASDASGGALTVAATVDGAPVTVTGTTSWSFFFPLSAQKKYVVKVTVTDVAGNSSTVTRNVIYDLTAPYLTLNPRNLTSPNTITGDVEPGATLSITGTGVTGSTLTRTAGSYSYAVTGTSINYNTIQVTATDAAGNTTSLILNAGKPDGDLNNDILLDRTDVQVCLAITAGLRASDIQALTHGDIGPLNAGLPNPDGTITVVDCQLLLQKSLNSGAW